MAKERAVGAIGREIGRTLQIFARTARARQLYAPNNAILRRMIEDLTHAFGEVLKVAPEITIKVRPEALLYEDEVVLDEPNPDQSIPFVYFRDGIRRLDFSRGLEPREIQILLDATAQGFNFSGFGDDIVARLWHHDLEHLRYLVLDTSIVDATQGAGAANPSPDAYDVDAQIDGLLHAIYGDSSDDVGPKSLHVDRTDLPAKAIADTLDAVEELAPGFFPQRAFVQPPAYAWDIREAVQAEGETELAWGTAAAAIAALTTPLPDAELRALSDGLLRIYDAALVNRDLKLASKIVNGVRRLESGANTGPATRWLAEGISDTRLRQVVQIYQSTTTDEDRNAILRFFRVCGPAAVPSLLGMLPNFSEASVRRRFSDVALEIGIDRLEVLQELLANEQAFVAQEAVYLLSQLGTDEGWALLSAAVGHQRIEVRMAVLEAADALPPARLQALVTPMLEDPEPRLKAAAARAFGRAQSPEALATIERFAVAPEFEREPYEVKRAFLTSYAILGQVRAISVLANYLKRGDGLLAKKELEELGAAAAEAIALIRTPRTVETLKKAVTSRSKRIRETARAALLRMKAGP